MYEYKNFSKPKCLIVDDLDENLLALKSLLADEAVEVIQASSGLEALDLLLQHDFALALLDIQMPDMDGFELAEIMRSTEKTKGIPIIFVTAAEADSRRIFQGYEAGAVDFLQKPLAPQIVISKVNIFLQLYLQKEKLQHKILKIEHTENILQQALRSRDEFLSICSHELRTPLTTLKMQLQLTNRLKEKKGAEVAFTTQNMERFLSQANRSVERLIHLVNDMLDISRVSTGKLTLKLEEVDLTKLVHDISERLNYFVELTNPRLKIVSHKEVVGLWDKFRLEQVITNLFINAAKYAPESPIEVQIEKNDTNAILKVIDQGDGIPLEFQDKIFERFSRGVSQNDISGLGLGLFISKQIIEQHHGKISLESRPGEGATFIIHLPLV